MTITADETEITVADHIDTTTKKTIIVFSGEMDRVLAAFVLANAAAAMDDEVTMFFTFWGLNVLRKDHPPHPRKTLLQKMFSRMMPRGPEHLALSHMNFAGMGPVLMKKAMRDAHVTPLQELIDTAREQGVKFVACTMSMDVMGIRAEELIDGLEFAGAASYLGEADEANVNLFI
ncbi:MAG TPA: DsrE/DsrF/DrsH-like family protein [Gaiellaceae bacterium]|nr:DsrE/DsrF/DrsH-like family protein [Gaiellaceae bacterium]